MREIRKKYLISGLYLTALILFIMVGYSASASTLEELKALPYVSWSDQAVGAEDLRGVRIYNKEKAFNGYNIYTDFGQKAYLIDMSGDIVHTWEFSDNHPWEYAELLDNGELVAESVNRDFIKIDKDSNVIWKRPLRPHHDIEILDNGSYLLLVYNDPVIYNLRKLQFESILNISENGEIIWEWPVFENFNKIKKHHLPSRLDKKPNIQKNTTINDQIYDYYHLNTVEILPDTPLAKKAKCFQQGNYLVCFANVDLISIIDKDTKEIVWSWGPGILDRPHMPTMLKNGNILIYDNGAHRSYSRVIELNPIGYNIVWEYKDSPPENFYSKAWGSNQRLPNGNTLIAESSKGRVFEVTNDGEIVWEFLNPNIKDGKRKIIYRMMRVPAERVSGWIDR